MDLQFMRSVNDSSTSDNGQFDNLLSYKTNWRHYFMRLWQRNSSWHCQSSLWIHSAITSLIHSYFDNGRTKFTVKTGQTLKNWRQFAKRGVLANSNFCTERTSVVRLVLLWPRANIPYESPHDRLVRGQLCCVNFEVKKRFILVTILIFFSSQNFQTSHRQKHYLNLGKNRQFTWSGFLLK